MATRAEDAKLLHGLDMLDVQDDYRRTTEQCGRLRLLLAAAEKRQHALAALLEGGKLLSEAQDQQDIPF